MAKYKLNGKTYNLRLDMGVLEHMEEEFGGMREAFEVMARGKGRIKAIRCVFAWMVNAANEYDGSDERVTGDELKHADMKEFALLSDAIQRAAEESTHAETSRGGEADSGTYDNYLAQIEEEEKKRTPEQSE